MSVDHAKLRTTVTLFGAEAASLRPVFDAYASLELVEEAPDVVVCYGGDGTLLSAELRWPGIPKVPIRNSRRGNKMMGHPVEEVVQRLAEGTLAATPFLKLDCQVNFRSNDRPVALTALNEINVQLGVTNTALRFKIWIDGRPFEHATEFIGDGLLASTPFGSTAYYRQITRGVFYGGLGLALKSTNELTNHVVVPESATIRIAITRGPAVLAYDNWPEYININTGDELLIQKSEQSATILTWEPMTRPSDED